MDPDEKELSPPRKASSSLATKSSGRGGTANSNLSEVVGELLPIDMDEMASNKPSGKAVAQSSPSLNANVSEVPASRTGENVSLDVNKKPSSRLSDESLKIFLRIRPIVVSTHKSKSLKPSSDKIAWPKLKVGKEKVKMEKKKTSCIQVCDCHSVTILPPSTLNRMKSEVYGGFSQVFSADSSQEEVYAKTVSPIVEDFLIGKSGLLAASGPSGSGKTHTVFGSNREPGLVPRALRHIFHPSDGSQDGPKRLFYLSIFEIYVDNGKVEKLSDLSPDGGEVQLQQSGLKGLKELLITDYMQAEALITRSMLRRNIAMANSNSHGRSQCIIQIHCSIDNNDGRVETQVKESVLTFVDLTGAEREKITGSQWDRLPENYFINKTSMVFGLCIKSLLEHQKDPKKPLRKHFKSSLLTRYLRDYLEGKKHMALILTVRPAEEDYLETSFLLRQASPNMEIKFFNKDEIVQSKRRHYETMFNAVPEQSKRMKIHCHSDSMDTVKISTDASKPCKDSLYFGDEEFDEVYRKEVSAKPRKVPVSKVNGEVTRKTVYADSEKEREYKILLGIGKSIWSSLKEHNQKIKVLEKRNMELQKQISDLKSCRCACQKKAFVDVVSLVTDANSERSLSNESVGHRIAASEGYVNVSKETEKQLDICKNGCDCPEEQRSTSLEFKGDTEVESNSFSSELLELPEDHLSSCNDAKENEIVGELEDGCSTTTKELGKEVHICKTESEHSGDDFEGEIDDSKATEQADMCKNGCDCSEDQRCTYLKFKGDNKVESKSYSFEPVQLPEDNRSSFREGIRENEIEIEEEDCQQANMKELEKEPICNAKSEHPQDDCGVEIDVSKETVKQADACDTGPDCPQGRTPSHLKFYSSESVQFPEEHVSAFRVAKQEEMSGGAENFQSTNVMELEKKACISKTEPEHCPQHECQGSQNFQGDVNSEGSYQGRDLEKKDNKETCSDKIMEACYDEKMLKSSSDLSSAIAPESNRRSTRKNGKQQKYVNVDGGNFNAASEPGEILIPRDKSSVRTKSKRRLMPASSTLLRPVNNLDFKEEGPVGGRRERSSADDSRIATSSASLLRLLRFDAHL